MQESSKTREKLIVSCISSAVKVSVKDKLAQSETHPAHRPAANLVASKFGLAKLFFDLSRF